MKNNQSPPTSTLNKIRPSHLSRDVYVYIRQSTILQVKNNHESTERQYALQNKALQYGWNQSQIHVIDEDLGKSGTGRVDRSGFKDLIYNVTIGNVGAIFGLEISRLARNSADILKLTELCGLFDTLIIDNDGIYDLTDFNDRMLLGLKGTIGEAELHFIRMRLQGAKDNAAEKGILRFPLPVGYVYTASSELTKDPDEQIQLAISELFHIFELTGTAYGVVKYFSDHQMQFPKRTYGGLWNGRLIWGPLGYGRVLEILHNPAYAGAYVYGRYKDNKAISPDGYYLHHIVRQSNPEDWQVCLRDHHSAYISWETFEQNQKKLFENRTNSESKGASHEGRALLQGIIICGKCGKRMSPRYIGDNGKQIYYECGSRFINGHNPPCHCYIQGSDIDNAVVDKLFHVLEPAQIELTILALEKLHAKEENEEQLWKTKLERAQYEVSLAEKQYYNTDPENRLVARTLEKNWNTKLEELEQIKRDFSKYQSTRPWIPSKNDTESIRMLSEKIPYIWNSGISNNEKKRLIRLIIKDVTVTYEKDDRFYSIGIRYQGGICEQILLAKRLPISLIRLTKDSTIERVRELAPVMDDKEIADQLLAEGILTGTGKPHTVDSVQWIRNKYQIKGLYQVTLESSIGLHEAADLLGINYYALYNKVLAGIIPASRIRPKWPYRIFLTRDELLALKNRIK